MTHLEKHKLKMETKRQIRQRDYDNRDPAPFIFANLSKNHPNYGDTPAEHERRKNSS